MWHGANWTFIIWGFLHGAYSLIETNLKIKQFKPESSFKLKYTIRILITFAFVSAALVFFRANTISDAFYIFQNLFSIDFSSIIGVPIYSQKSFLLCLIAILIFYFADLFNECILPKIKIGKGYYYTITIIQILLIYAWGVFEEQEFIYFQF